MNFLFSTGQRLLSSKLPPWFNFASFFACLLYLFFFYVSHWDAKTGFTGMLRYGDRFGTISKVNSVPRAIVHGPGFDGQFYATMAVDPLLRDTGLKKTIDAPSYRYKRIALSWIAYCAGLARPRLVLNAYALLNGLFWVLLAVLLFFVFRPRTVQHVLVCALLLFGTGTIESLDCALTDLPAAVFILAALFAPKAWPLALGAAILTRETSIFAIPAMGVSINNRSVKVHWKGIIGAVLPFVAWGVYVSTRAESRAVVGGLGFPLLAMAHRVGSSLYHLRLGYNGQLVIFALVAASFCVQAAYFIRHRSTALPVWRLGLCFSLLFACLGSTVWMDYFWVIRAMLPMTFAFCLCLADMPPRTFLIWWPAGIIGSLFVR